MEWVTARRFYTMEDNGLTQPWTGRVWMNPPYSEATPWVRKFIAHGHGVALLPFAKSRWLVDLWESAEGVAVFREGFPNFVGGSIMLPVFFAAFGDDCVEAIGRIGDVRFLAGGGS